MGSTTPPKPMSVVLDGKLITERYCVCGHSELDHYKMKNDPCARCQCNSFKGNSFKDMPKSVPVVTFPKMCCGKPVEFEKLGRRERVLCRVTKKRATDCKKGKP
jgi:hypothetical protein